MLLVLSRNAPCSSWVACFGCVWCGCRTTCPSDMLKNIFLKRFFLLKNMWNVSVFVKGGDNLHSSQYCVLSAFLFSRSQTKQCALKLNSFASVFLSTDRFTPWHPWLDRNNSVVRGGDLCIRGRGSGRSWRNWSQHGLLIVNWVFVKKNMLP